jgi:hypothetical protein
MRDAPGPADGSPDPRPPRPRARGLRFVPATRYGGPAADRRFAIVVSAVLHLLLLTVLLLTDAVRLPDFGSLLEEPAPIGRERVVLMPIDGFPGPRTTATPSAIEPIVTTPAPPIRAPSPTGGVPSPAPALVEPAAPSGRIPGFGEGEGAGAAGAGVESARERFNRAIEALRPREMSPLLRDASLDRLRTDAERAQLRAYARIRALNDSIIAEIEAGRRATDWTWTDEQGRRWGISPGKLHLGGITIPLPLSTTGSREDRDLLREWQEIQAQAEQGAIDETFDERVEEIRARRDAERAEQ